MSDDPLDSDPLDEADDPLERGLIYLREIEWPERDAEELEACLNGDPPDYYTISDRAAAEWVLREIARKLRFVAERLEKWADDADTGLEDLPRLEKL